MKNKVAIITDSTCDMTQELYEKYNVRMLSLFVNFSNGSYLDGIDIDSEKLYGLVDQYKELPKTAAIPIGEFINVFEEYVKEGYEVIFLGIGADLSSTCNNARIASEEVDPSKIYIFDSMNLSTGTGLLVLKACKYRDLGLSASEIIEKLTYYRPLVKAQFAIETMEYLYKGGRCSGLTKWFGTLFKIKPLIEVRHGKMDVAKLPRGKMKVALDTLLSYIDADKDNVDLDHIFVTHSQADESAKYLIPELKKRYPDVDILETFAGSVVSSHCGRGTIGILYIVNSIEEKK